MSLHIVGSPATNGDLSSPFRSSLGLRRLKVNGCRLQQHLQRMYNKTSSVGSRTPAPRPRHTRLDNFPAVEPDRYKDSGVLASLHNRRAHTLAGLSLYSIGKERDGLALPHNKRKFRENRRKSTNQRGLRSTSLKLVLWVRRLRLNVNLPFARWFCTHPVCDMARSAVDTVGRSTDRHGPTARKLFITAPEYLRCRSLANFSAFFHLLR
jgi:hypothetical protein